MMPLWTTATLSVACGCALLSVGLPWVAQRVWPMPVWPASGSARSRALEILQLAFGAAALEMVAFQRGDAGGIVAAIFQPLERIHHCSATGPRPRMPTMPHMRINISKSTKIAKRASIS